MLVSSVFSHRLPPFLTARRRVLKRRSQSSRTVSLVRSLMQETNNVNVLARDFQIASDAVSSLSILNRFRLFVNSYFCHHFPRFVVKSRFANVLSPIAFFQR